MKVVAGFSEQTSRLVPLCAGLLLLLLSACRHEQPTLKIGFIGGLTGRVSGLGVAGRDGVLLAAEEINRTGGIKGRTVEIVARDDQQDSVIARQVTRELIDDGVVAILGPMTSVVAVAIQPIANREQVVLLSPTVTANQFNDQDDWFFRVIMPLRTNAGKLAEYALSQRIGTVAVSVDTGNAAFTEDWLASFQQPFEAGGGKVVRIERFQSSNNGGFLPLAERLIKSRPDALLLLSGAMDTALIAQQVRKLGSSLPLFAAEWAFTGDIVSFGGQAIENMRAFVTYNPGDHSARHQVFRDDFEKRFGYKPSFAAALAYEAACDLFVGLEQNPRRQGLKETLLRIGSFDGLQGGVRIDRFGEPERKTFLATVRNGQFTVIE
jgi:branched-chain amino acid transport system substrate-binding protein